jgi:hypothetical protein
MKIRDWISVLKCMNPNLDARVMYESTEAIVVNAWPAPPPIGPGPVAGAEAEAILKPSGLPDPIQTLRDLFDAGDLDDHFYSIREREGVGWEGSRMKKWSKACEDAHKLM